jgi:hypothetical protein
MLVARKFLCVKIKLPIVVMEEIKMIKHIVMWKLKDFADNRSKNENMQIMKNMLENLEDKIAEIEKMEVGFNINSSEMAYDLVLYSEFKNEEALGIYQNHPEHIKVKEFVAKVREKRVVVDYKA